ncbi:hydroquinone glucosyltransferase [Quercus suber]|uniref:Hydroquinone glucosyltransferase n=1 Tax=Quercus suber TaxID=58331 RepID=A0AAW0L4B6_QUESU
MALLSVFYLPELDQKFSCEYRDLPEPVKLPGCVPLHGSDLIDPIQDRQNECYKIVLRCCKQHPLAAGIMVNSFMDLEPGAFKALMERGEGKPMVYPIGPLIKSGSDIVVDESGAECLRWLDKQPRGSVLYVSFGSGGTLSREQLNELALGLEMSGQRFLWVVRSPHEKAANATYFSVQSINDPFDFLPKGFLERTKEVASRVKVNDEGLVGHKDIANYARGLMEGEEGKLFRSKMKELKDAAEKTLSLEGWSTKSLAEVTQLWKRHQK